MRYDELFEIFGAILLPVRITGVPKFPRHLAFLIALASGQGIEDIDYFVLFYI